MGFITDLFSGSKAYQAKSGLQPGQLEQTYQQQQDALAKMAAFVAATQPGSAQGLAAQQALSGQLSGMAQGQGPSVSEALLQKQAQDTAKQIAAIGASQRGASQNVGLIGRQAARAGADIYERSAAQALPARIQEQMNAIEQLRQLSGQQVEQQRLGTAQFGQAGMQAQQQALQAQYQQEALRTEMAKQQEATRGNIIGGLISGAGAALGVGAGKGGGGGAGMAPGTAVPGLAEWTPGFSKGGQVTPTEQPRPVEQPDIVSLLLESQNMAHGSVVPGKAKVDGDSYSNDTVPALLSPGEIVVPRSAAKDPEKAAAFAKSVAMRSGKRKKK